MFFNTPQYVVSCLHFPAFYGNCSTVFRSYFDTLIVECHWKILERHARTANTNTHAKRKMVSGHMHCIRLGFSISYCCFYRLSNVRRFAIFQMIADNFSLFFVHWTRINVQRVRIFSQWFICAVRKSCLEFESLLRIQRNSASFGVFLCAFKESLKLFIIFNTKTGRISPWKCLFLRADTIC